MCDEWAKKDERIKVIHKKNGGLSDARNTGIDAAKGDFITFIDSDDYVALEMVEKLHSALIKNDADMSICNFTSVDDNGRSLDDEVVELPVKDEILSGQEAAFCEVNRSRGAFVIACAKLYKKRIFTDVRFPSGIIHEDSAIAHHAFLKCKRVVCISDACYYYVQRKGSII